MSFINDIKTVFDNNTTLVNLINGGIAYQNLTDNWLSVSKNDKWILYDFTKGQVDCLNSKNVYSTFTLSVVVIQRNANDQIDSISNMVRNMLNGISYNGIVDINFVSDSGGFNQQQSTYTNTLEFNVIYIDS